MTGPQVDAATHYRWEGYTGLTRWVSYWQQIDAVLKCRPSSCVEIGIGNGLVLDQLRRTGLDVTSIDFDPRLRPDRTGDVRSLPCSDAEFDVALCAEVLEHIPFAEAGGALDELRRVARRRVVLSVPQFGRTFHVSARIPPFRKVGISRRIPSRHRFTFDGEHYWELGARGARPADFLRLLSARFTVLDDSVAPENEYHRFFVLEPR